MCFVKKELNKDAKNWWLIIFTSVIIIIIVLNIVIKFHFSLVSHSNLLITFATGDSS